MKNVLNSALDQVSSQFDCSQLAQEAATRWKMGGGKTGKYSSEPPTKKRNRVRLDANIYSTSVAERSVVGRVPTTQQLFCDESRALQGLCHSFPNPNSRSLGHAIPFRPPPSLLPSYLPCPVSPAESEIRTRIMRKKQTSRCKVGSNVPLRSWLQRITSTKGGGGQT